MLSISFRRSVPAVILACLAPFSVLAGTGLTPIHTSACQPYTSSEIDPALLRIRADGITNDYDTSKFVICPLPKSAPDAAELTAYFEWHADYDREISVWFRRLSGAPIVSNECTLTAGWNGNDPIQSVTRPVHATSSTYGVVAFDETTGPSALPTSTAVLVCRIAPGNKMDRILLVEPNPFA